MIDIDESLVLEIFGVLLGIAALAYFGFDTILDLSPVLKSFILLAGAGGFLVASDLFHSMIFRGFLYILSSFTYLSFLIYTVARFDLGSGQVFSILVVSAVAFMVLGYMKGERGLKLERGQSKKVLLGIAVLITGLVIFDALGAQPEYELNLKESVEVREAQEFSLGTLVVRNNFTFSRNMDVPDMRGCIGGEKSRRIYSSISSDDIIAGKTEQKFNITEIIRSRPDVNTSVSGNYTIVQEECPEEPQEGVIYAVIDSEEDAVERRVD